MMADTKKPYGSVRYADEGMQPDGKARYPIDSLEHCKAAWAYVNMPKNAAKYTAEQLAKIKSRIKAAGKRYGIEFADDAKKVSAAAGDLRGVELARPGPWHTKTGQKSFSAQDLKDAADFFAVSGGQAVPVKLGHDDARFDGEPSFGSVTNVRYVEDERGPVLLGDIVDMPSWLAASAPKRWPNRSIEGWQKFVFNGREYSLILSGLAFLGVTPPAMRNIRSLTDLQNAIAASSAQRVFASAPIDDLAAPPPTPAPAGNPTTKEADHMSNVDPVKFREALGLSADASDDEVRSTLAATDFAAPKPEPAPVQAALFEPPAVKPEPVTASDSRELDQRIAAAAAKGGVITIDAATVAQFQEGMVRAAALAKRLDEQDRDTTITKAIKDGKFPPARRAHYERSWDIDPVGTKELIASLAANLVPVTASGYAGDVERQEDELDREIARLSDPSRKVANRG